MNNLAWQYSLRGDGRAVEVAEQAHALAPSNASITDTLGWILAKEGRIEQALPLLREAVDKLPDNAEVRFHLAYVLAETGERTEAKSVLDELLSSDAVFDSRIDAERLMESL
jgi:Flp pilus assembly protein TadD